MENITTEQLGYMLVYTQDNLNDFFTVISAILVFGMQAGFVLMEAGLVRSKNVVHVLLESTLDAFIGATVYWLFGYAFAFGDGNDFIGWSGFALAGVSERKYSFWFYQVIFANTASTITSGSVAERLETKAFFFYSVLFTGLMYPISSRWIWHDDGWLRRLGVIDVGGSGIVHMQGGVCALVATLFVGSRLGRFGPKGTVDSMPGHSLTMTAVGGLILMIGTLGYNMSSLFSLSKAGDGATVSTSAINTLLGGAGGSITAFIFARFTPSGKYRYSFLMMLNGAIAGMVASCAGCNVMPLWAGYVTGVVAGFMFYALRSLLHKLRVDDVMDAFPVHFGGGFTGMVMTPLLSPKGLLIQADLESAIWLGNQLLGTLVIIVWAAFFTSVLFGFLKRIDILRITPEHEKKGLDAGGELAYPVESWEDEQQRVLLNRRVLELAKVITELEQNTSAAIPIDDDRRTKAALLLNQLGSAHSDK